MAEATAGSPLSTSPERGTLVLLALILVAAVANLNLAVANIALPDIGKAFDASQTGLDLGAVGYSLGLAASVLYLGALGDRHGRKMMLVLGVGLSIPACLLAAYAPTMEMLFLARLLGGLAAGMAYPTTLALITALWSGPARTRSIALWSALGGILSVVLVAALVLAINFAAVPDARTLAIGLALIALAGGVAFVIRQRRARSPLYDLDIAARRVFWVAAVGGIIVFGSLMAAMFVGQQFLQNVLGYEPIQAGAAILPAVVLMVVVAPRSAKLVESRGARFTLLLGYVFCLLGFLAMLALLKEHIPYWKVGLGYALVGVGVGFAGTPASHSLTSSVPVRRARMASGTADLQRDLGGAIMQSILGALLTAGYATAFSASIASSANAGQVGPNVESELTKSFSGAASVAQQYPQYSKQIVDAAKTSFIDGANWAYGAGIVAILIGITLVFFLFPKRQREQELLADYATQDATTAARVTRTTA